MTTDALWNEIKNPEVAHSVRAVLARTLLRQCNFLPTRLESGLDSDREEIYIQIADCGCVATPLFKIVTDDGEILDAMHDPISILGRFKDMVRYRPATLSIYT